jgi:hypothetical protein
MAVAMNKPDNKIKVSENATVFMRALLADTLNKRLIFRKSSFA